LPVANKKHLAKLREGVEAWNAWRREEDAPRETDLDDEDVEDEDDIEEKDIEDDEDLDAVDAWRVDLSGADLSETDLQGANLSGVNLHDVNLRAANLWGADLSKANLRAANLCDANLTEVNLTEAELTDADLHEAVLRDANLTKACLHGANLDMANLMSANLHKADLIGAHLYIADLRDSNLKGVHLSYTNLNGADLTGANLTDAKLSETVLADANLTGVVGLDTCHHFGSSVIDHRTLRKSGTLPLSFQRGLGLPDSLINYIPTLLNDAIQYYSCFISYSSKDQEFAERIHADLQNKGVRCWFAPHDMSIGGKILDEIDTAIRLRDKLLLILSEHSIKSDWVEDEVSKAFEEERRRNQIALFPIRLDDAVLDTDEPWAAKLRAQRHIGDFRKWKDHNAYKISFECVMRDLAPKAKGT
jgi:uncharacterized protein YjbI with pentapeptide repeats